MGAALRYNARFIYNLQTEKSVLNLVKPKPNLDCKYHFPIDLEPIEIMICEKGNRKGYLHSKFGFR